MRVFKWHSSSTLLLWPLLVAACHATPPAGPSALIASVAPAAVQANPASPAPGASPMPSARPALGVTVLNGLSQVNRQPLAGAQLRVVDAISGKPLGIVAAGAGNIVATGGGNIVATGAGNIVATGGGNIVAGGGGNFHLVSLPGGHYDLTSLAGKRLVTDAKGTFKLAVAGLAPGRVARVIATANGKTVTCLVSGSGKTTGGRSKKKYGLAQAPDDGDLVALGDASFQVTAEVALTVSPATTVVDNSYTPMLGLLGRLKEKVRADKLDHLLDDASGQEVTLERQFDAHPQAEEVVAAKADPDTGDMPDGLVKSTLDDAGVLDDVQGDATACAKDVATAQTDPANLATPADHADEPIDPTLPMDTTLPADTTLPPASSDGAATASATPTASANP